MFLENAGKIKLKILDAGETGICSLECLTEAVEECEEGKFLVSLAHVSNVTAGIIDVKAIGKIIHEREGIFQLDAAQSFPHMPVDVQDLDVDLMGVSIHKACGPSHGFLYGKYHLLEKVNPLILGGETVSDVMMPNTIKMLPPPAKFEAGLQNYAGGIATGTTIDYLASIGMKNVHDHEVKLSKAMLNGLKNEFGDTISYLGPKNPEKRAALAAIDLKTVNPHEVAILLDDMYNIFLRSGYHCTHAFHHSLELDQGTLRPSWYLYNTEDEVKLFIEALSEIMGMLG